MRHRIARFGLIAALCALTATAGFTASAQPTIAWRAPRDIAAIAALGMPAIPAMPKPFTIPNAPIVPADPDGYLPSSWQVTPKGEFAYSIPLAVPPGRLGTAPALSIDYLSGTGNGLVGFGWSLSGILAHHARRTHLGASCDDGWRRLHRARSLLPRRPGARRRQRGDLRRGRRRISHGVRHVRARAIVERAEGRSAGSRAIHR